jgi:peptidoglycan/LPS O-acetylase OafA/YrhL
MSSSLRRVRSLDGLRGVAAAIVVAGHLVNASVPSLSAVNTGQRPRLDTLQSVFAYSPLHIIYAGQDWVIVFFVLSGFVLSLAASRGARFVASHYYPSRLVRLYVPVWGALLIAALAHLAVSHNAVTGATLWLNQHDTPLSIGRVAHDATLVFGAGDGSFSTVLWSLRWEVLFSLLLPLYLILARRRPLWAAGLSLGLILLAGPHNDYARYMPTFMLGVALAYGDPRLAAHLTPGRVWALLCVSLCCLSANWWMPAGFGQNIGMTLTAASATGLLICAIHCGQLRALLNSKALQVVGKRSFSLYLVHEPLVVAIAFALGGRPDIVVLAAASLPLVAVLTEVFYRLVERPSHTWARWAGEQTLVRTGQLRAGSSA